MAYLKGCKFDRHCFEFSHVNFIKIKKKTSVPAENSLLWFILFFLPKEYWVENWCFYTTNACRRNLSFMWELHPQAFRKQIWGPSLPLMVSVWGCPQFLSACHIHQCPEHPPAISSSASSWEANANGINFSYMVGRVCVCILVTCGSTNDFSKHLKSCKESNISGFST